MLYFTENAIFAGKAEFSGNDLSAQFVNQNYPKCLMRKFPKSPKPSPASIKNLHTKKNLTRRKASLRQLTPPLWKCVAEYARILDLAP